MLILAAAALAAAPTSANAAVTISFAGSSGGTGQIVIDTAHLGALTTLSSGDLGYAGDGSTFLTASFVDGAGQQLLQQGVLDGYIAYNDQQSTIEVGYTFDDGNGNVAQSNLTLLGDDVPLATFEGVRLPDFRQATNVYFSVDAVDGGSIAGSAGRLAITATATPAVPEPATWAMMIAGFALVGGALRRRRGAAAIPA